MEWVQDNMGVEINTPPKRFLDNYTEKAMYIKQATEMLPMYKAGTVVILSRGLLFFQPSRRKSYSKFKKEM